MAYEQKEGDIAIFRVKEKKNEKGPDFTGKALIDGKLRDVSMWIKGDGFFAGTVKDKYQPDFDKARESVHNTQKSNGYQPQVDIDDDEIPF